MKRQAVTQTKLKDSVNNLNLLYNKDWLRSQDMSGMYLEGKKYKHIIGWFVLDKNSQGYQLCKVINEDGGERNLTARVTPREIQAYIAGIRYGIHQANGENS